MAVPTKPVVPPVPLRTDPATFHDRVADFIRSFPTLISYIAQTNDFTNTQAQLALAAAMATNLPGLDLASLAGQLVGVNAAGTAFEGTPGVDIDIASEMEAIDGTNNVNAMSPALVRAVTDRLVVDLAGPFYNAGKSIVGSVLEDAGIDRPEGLAFDGDGDLLVLDSGTNRMVYGFRNGAREMSKDLDYSALPTQSYVGVAVDADDDILILADSANITNVYGFRNGSRHTAKDISDATMGSAGVNDPRGITVDGDGDVIIVDSAGYARGFRGGMVHSAKDIPASAFTDAGCDGEGGIAVDLDGDVLVVDITNAEVCGFRGDVHHSAKDIPADRLRVALGSGIAVDSDGDIFVADRDTNRIYAFIRTLQLART